MRFKRNNVGSGAASVCSETPSASSLCGTTATAQSVPQASRLPTPVKQLPSRGEGNRRPLQVSVPSGCGMKVEQVDAEDVQLLGSSSGDTRADILTLSGGGEMRGTHSRVAHISGSIHRVGSSHGSDQSYEGRHTRVAGVPIAGSAPAAVQAMHSRPKLTPREAGRSKKNMRREGALSARSPSVHRVARSLVEGAQSMMALMRIDFNEPRCVEFVNLAVASGVSLLDELGTYAQVMQRQDPDMSTARVWNELLRDSPTAASEGLADGMHVRVQRTPSKSSVRVELRSVASEATVGHLRARAKELRNLLRLSLCDEADLRLARQAMADALKFIHTLQEHAGTAAMCPRAMWIQLSNR